MDARIIKRLDKELTNGYQVVEFDGKPIRINYTFRCIRIPINIGYKYPFGPPISIGNWNHAKYELLAPYIRDHLQNNQCLYCSVYENWKPVITIHTIIERFIAADTLISNCVKLNVVCRNTLHLPYDVLHIIFSYLH